MTLVEVKGDIDMATLVPDPDLIQGIFSWFGWPPSRKPSDVAEYKTESHHNISWESIRILDKADREYPRLEREATLN